MRTCKQAIHPRPVCAAPLILGPFSPKNQRIQAEFGEKSVLGLTGSPVVSVVVPLGLPKVDVQPRRELQRRAIKP